MRKIEVAQQGSDGFQNSTFGMKKNHPVWLLTSPSTPPQEGNFPAQLNSPPAEGWHPGGMTGWFQCDSVMFKRYRSRRYLQRLEAVATFALMLTTAAYAQEAFDAEKTKALFAGTEWITYWD